jgi:hypothetical protein
MKTQKQGGGGGCFPESSLTKTLQLLGNAQERSQESRV